MKKEDIVKNNFSPCRRILITGGTGSFGKAFLKELLINHSYIERIVIYSRDELKQWELQQDFPEKKFPQVRFMLGNIRDRARLISALEGIDTVVHAAALKQVPAAEYNPIEFIYTNVIGAENLIQACISTRVKRVIALSTDKASAPVNLYGATKLCSDKLFIAANNIVGSKNILFSVVRYGNVMGSRGSVIPFFIKKSKTGVLPITDINMTRFNICLREGINMVLWAIDNSLGGEIFVPKIPSYNVSDLADAIGPNCKKEIIGLRPGEKIHEEMITTSDSYSTIDIGKYYAILPSDGKLARKYLDLNLGIKKVPIGFSYSSGTNDNFLTVNQIRELIRDNLDKDFVPI